MGRPDGNTKLIDAHDLFERTLIRLCREHGLGERQEWDEVLALAVRERTLAELRRGR